MARTKQTAKRFQKRLITWTRFHLPRGQEWPKWSVDHDDIHVGPLVGVGGFRKASLGRMVEDHEQAAYIIEWATLDDLKNFQSSPACVEFLQNLPECSDSQVSGLGLGHLTLNDASSSSRFLTLKHTTEAITSNIEGRVALTAFLVPRKIDDKDIWGMWNDTFNSVFSSFIPRGSEFITSHHKFRFNFMAVWFWAFTEDYWVESKFGKLDQTQENNEGRTLFFHFHLWPNRLGVTPEHEEASAADSQARESWNEAIAKVMPPAVAWEQERWDIREVLRFYPPEPETDPEYPEYELEQRKGREEYLQLHGFKVGETSQQS